MNIPNLPTDNIYKFYALFGLVLLITTTYFYSNHNSEYAEVVIQTNSKIQYLNSVMKKAAYTKNLRVELMKDSISFNSKYFEMVLDEEEYLLREFDRLKIESDGFSNKMKALELKNEVVKNLFIIIYFVSILLIVVGFYFWQVKYQKYIDLELKLNYLKNQIEYDKLYNDLD